MKGVRALGAVLARLTLLATILAMCITGLVAGVSRAAQSPLPPLLYSNNSRLHLFETNCADWLAVCANRDRDLRVNLYQGFPVAQWSPDGEFIAALIYEGWMLYRADCLLKGGHCQPTPLAADAADVRLAWSPDGSALAYITESSERTLRIVSRGCWDDTPPQACIERTVNLPNIVLRSPDWSADGSRIAFMSEDYDLYTVDLACMDTPEGCANQVRLVPRHLPAQYWPSLSADGTTMLYNAGASHVTGQLFTLSLATGQRQQLTFRRFDSLNSDWAADERYIAYFGFVDNSSNSNIYLLDLQRALTVMPIRNPERDMFPNWGPLPQ
jgi:Tol biopolymer transport system component